MNTKSLNLFVKQIAQLSFPPPHSEIYPWKCYEKSERLNTKSKRRKEENEIASQSGRILSLFAEINC